MPNDILISESPEDTRRIAGQLAAKLKPGDVVLLEGNLGAGKTTFVRGFLSALNHDGPVRSPTFNLLQVFDTSPPVLHADLYRLTSAASLGLEDYLDTHILLIEWPQAALDQLNVEAAWRIEIKFQGENRVISSTPPSI